MRLLFVGGLFNPKQQQAVFQYSKRMPNMAANVHQWNIVNGLTIDTDIINPIFVGNYPNEYAKSYIKSEIWSHKAGSGDYSPSTINLFGFKQIHRLFSLSDSIRKWLLRQHEDAVVLLYSFNTSIILSYLIAKRRLRNTFSCLIIPDLPIYYIHNKGKGRAYRLLKKIDWLLMLRLANKMDSFILLTEAMSDVVPVEGKPYMICEGICTDESSVDTGAIHEMTVTYTGTLDEEFGILELLRNFSACAKTDWTLIIAGDGNARDEVLRYAQKDNRIRYLGVLKNKDTIALQRSSRLLINPRISNQEFTKYSFPSKTMEYLNAGRPVLMYKLEGVPGEYDPYLQYFADTSKESFCALLTTMMEKSDVELTAIGQAGKEFVASNKSVARQGERISAYLLKIRRRNQEDVQ